MTKHLVASNRAAEYADLQRLVEQQDIAENSATEAVWQFAAKVCGVLAIVTLAVGCIAALGGWQ